jgi:hypothetical protein
MFLALELIPFLMKLDLRWDIQQPITILGGDSLQPKPSVATWQWYETFM